MRCRVPGLVCCDLAMAWGRRESAAEREAWLGAWCARIAGNDVSLPALLVLRSRNLSEHDITRLCDAMVHASHLRELNMAGTHLSPTALEALCSMLEKNTSIEVLNVGDETLGQPPVNLRRLAAAVSANTNSALRVLDLENKGIDASGAQELAALLMNESCTLKSLNLSRNPVMVDGFAGLLGAGTFSLQKLQLAHCEISGQISVADEGDEYGSLSTFQSSCPELVELDLRANAIGTFPEWLWSRLVDFLCRRMPSLQRLWLAGCGLGEERVASLVIHEADMLSRLVELDLDANVNAARGLMESWQSTSREAPVLAVLRVSGTELGDKDLLKLAARIGAGNCKQLRTLAIKHNVVSSAGLFALLRAGQLHDIQAFHNPAIALDMLELVAREQHEVDDALANTSVRVLDLGACGLGLSELDWLVNALCDDKLSNLIELGLGGNPGCSRDDEQWACLLRKAELARPALHIVWETSDQKHERVALG
ncbi:Ribonuclease inhibitor [Porphyridium purpureum]|uniref:Ribonuclease inhibitor n=1 Tax=Porphyridium purpureum TaxID=35688 RepID=A0A5J4YM58_PORPP|nr:Ribonuclease inhibitor [Porphyridium purpureum]|eukprot:POR9716..scf295_9